MTALYRSDRFLRHRTGNHPERPQRLLAVEEGLSRSGLLEKCRLAQWEPASIESVGLCHTAEHVGDLKERSACGGGAYDADTVLCEESYDVALYAAGAACDAVERVLLGKDANAFCLVRPPGHHAVADRAMGFCLFNNVAVAAKRALELGVDRALIVDFDVHHGNGTQDLFWEDPRVGFLSIHRYPFWPGSGCASETGAGDGLGTTLNVPMAADVTPREYLHALASSLEHLADKLRPEIILVSAGFDAHRHDPIGSLGLDAEDFACITTLLVEAARSYCDGRLVSLLEGGYHAAALAECVQVHLAGLLDAAEESQEL
jgi:acetoin utilization deacetylase AcuC-like enzyme